MFEAEMSMTIKSIRREDLGSYICVAKNSLGDVESKIRLYGMIKTIYVYLRIKFLPLKLRFNFVHLFEIIFIEIPGNDRHIFQYPDERTVSEDEYGTEIYDEDFDERNTEKSNRVLDKANKWYSNDGKIIVTNNSASVLKVTIFIVTFISLFDNLS